MRKSLPKNAEKTEGAETVSKVIKENGKDK